MSRLLQSVTVVLLLALAVFLVAYVQNQRTVSECQERVNSTFRDDLTERARTTAADRAALRQLLTETIGADVPRAQARESLDRYLRTADDLASRTPSLAMADQPCQ